MQPSLNQNVSKSVGLPMNPRHVNGGSSEEPEGATGSRSLWQEGLSVGTSKLRLNQFCVDQVGEISKNKALWWAWWADQA